MQAAEKVNTHRPGACAEKHAHKQKTLNTLWLRGEEKRRENWSGAVTYGQSGRGILGWMESSCTSVKITQGEMAGVLNPT